MSAHKSEKELVRQWVEKWKVVSEEMDRLKTEELRALTEEEAARQFNCMDLPEALLWTPEERVNSSGLVEQQRIFSKAHGDASRFHGCT